MQTQSITSKAKAPAAALRPLLTVPDVASLTALSEYTVAKMARLGQIPGAVKLGKSWRFRAAAIGRLTE